MSGVVILGMSWQETFLRQRLFYVFLFFCLIRGPSVVRSLLADTKCCERSRPPPFITVCRPSRVALFKTITTTKHVVYMWMVEQDNYQSQSLVLVVSFSVS